MHGRTFKILKGGEVVTVWTDGPYRGERGTVISAGDFTKGETGIRIKLDMGHETVEHYKNVANGDNSQFKDEE